MLLKKSISSLVIEKHNLDVNYFRKNSKVKHNEWITHTYISDRLCMNCISFDNRFLGFESFSLKILKPFYYHFLATIVAVDKSHSILMYDPLYMTISPPLFHTHTFDIFSTYYLCVLIFYDLGLCCVLWFSVLGNIFELFL